MIYTDGIQTIANAPAATPPHEPWAIEAAREVIAFPDQYDQESYEAAVRVLHRDQQHRLASIGRLQERRVRDRRDALTIFNEEDR